MGTIDLRIPKLREGSYYPESLLEPRRRVERALCSVVMQCYVEGTSTRDVDHIAKAMGVTSMSRSTVSRICKDLDELVADWRDRPLDRGPYPFMWVDAIELNVREGGRVVNVSALIATAVNADGHREILGIKLGWPRPARPGRRSCVGSKPGGCPGCSWSPLMRTLGWSTRSPRSTTCRSSSRPRPER